jgi:hypothetical protein
MSQNLIFVVDDDLFHHTILDYVISKNVKNPTKTHDEINCNSSIL